MTKRKYQVGQKALVSVQVNDFDVTSVLIALPDVDHTHWVDRSYLSTADDFKDEHVQAIVDAAVEFKEHFDAYGTTHVTSMASLSNLYDAVQAKLDAEKSPLQPGDKVRIYASGPDEDGGGEDDGSEWRDCVVDVGVVVESNHKDFTKIRNRDGSVALYPRYFRIERIKS